MRIRILPLVLLTVFHTVFSQKTKTCDKPKEEEEIIEDINSIALPKCPIDEKVEKLTSRNSKRMTVSVAPRRRIVRRKKKASTVNCVKVTNKIKKIKKSTSLVGRLELDNNKIAEKLPFDFVEEKPKFSDCSDVSIAEQGKCFKKEILRHIKHNFRYPKTSFEKSIQGRVLVQFVIDEYGQVGEILTRGPVQGSELEEEAKRIITKLPKLTPGRMAGNPIKVKYGVPITFKIPGKLPSNVRKKNRENVALSDVVNFANIQKIPLFTSCKAKKSDDDKLNCFNSKMAKHVQKYFAYPDEAANNNIQGRVYAYFVIDKEGDVVNIKTRGPKNGEMLEYATKKIVEKLPKFIPGKQNGKVMNVKYAFPINFRLN